MTEIILTITDEIIDISVSGHADYADYGSDIVCAGVSAVTFGIINLFDNIGANIHISNGDVRIRYTISNDDEYIRGVTDLAISAYTALFENYPDNVNLILIE